MLVSRLYGDMLTIRSIKSVPGAHLIGGESRSAIQTLSTRTKLGDQQYQGMNGKRQHGEVADKPGSQPWRTSSWTPRGYPLSNMSMLPVTGLSMPMSRGQI